MDLERLKQAAEESAWLVRRGYLTDAVAEFVASQRELDAEHRAVLRASTRLDAHYPHHIARELDPEDVAKRPLRVDAASVLSTVAAALRGGVLLQSPAGVVCDPGFTRPGSPTELDAAVDRICGALRAARPSLARWFVDDSAPWADALAASIGRRRGKLGMELERVPDGSAALAGASFVVSSDPAVLDQCVSWFNLVTRALEGTSANVLGLQG